MLACCIYLPQAPASSFIFLIGIWICAIFVCQDDFEHAYVCAACGFSIAICELRNMQQASIVGRVRYVTLYIADKANKRLRTRPRLGYKKLDLYKTINNQLQKYLLAAFTYNL